MLSPARNRLRRGVVLIVVLGALTLLSLLLIVLLEGAAHQTRSAESSSLQTREKIAADSAVALVMSQITQATSPAGQAWISQPGLLRTYTAAAGRHPTACYKLYSSLQLTDTSGTMDFLAADVPGDWSTDSAGYVDLNQPVHPAGLLDSTIYPIFDPAAENQVEGLSVDSAHGPEMPVAWLYQLQDGSLGPASNATAQNPLVARMAFWTDDDTCKVNLNTAGCGSPWDVPHVNTQDDVTWSTTAPAWGEYSRYPGHPASTSLQGIFGLGLAGLTPDELLQLSPRYATGGSDFGTQKTSAGQIMAGKFDRFYSSSDEAIFQPGLDAQGSRPLGSLSATTLEQARFVLTARSAAPETTLLGEPRLALWPVSDQKDALHQTAEDRAVAAAATLQGTAYYLQRHNAFSTTDDLDPAVVPRNQALLTELIARGGETEPGQSSTLSQKYAGNAWPQIALECLAFIRNLNVIDPHPAPFVSYTGSTGFTVPLHYLSNQTTLQGFGRCPTLVSLTLVCYVSGYNFSDGTHLDFDETPDDNQGTLWNKNLAIDLNSRWAQVVGERVHAFLVPSTFQPSCGYPEIQDGAKLEIDGLDQFQLSDGITSTALGFPGSGVSRPLGDALAVLPQERAWGGQEGPLVWRAASRDDPSLYPFRSQQTFLVPFRPTQDKLDPLTGGPSLSASWSRQLTFQGGQVTVKMEDGPGHVLQTLQVTFPATTFLSPYANGEFDHADGTSASTSRPDWATASQTRVAPSYYMNFGHRLQATQLNRALLIQAGDIVRSVEAGTDLRVIAGLNQVPAAFFQPHPSYAQTATRQAHNLRFADGTSACFASGTVSLIRSAAYPSSVTTWSVPDWENGVTLFSYPQLTTAPCSAPTGSLGVTLSLPGSPLPLAGDWDTGPGFAPDGALLNLPDAGTSLAPAAAYFSLAGGAQGAPTQRAPNALIASPVALGSLPAGLNPDHPAQSQPWRTLLFCPYPAADAAHPGFASPPDALLLDQFWMPVVDPYPLSTCFTTAGKVNLNDQICPFTYLHRQTALRAVLRDVRMAALSPGLAAQAKVPGAPLATIWQPLDVTATLALLENRFSAGDAYLSASEICAVPLVPQGQTAATLDHFWESNTGGGHLTGDNLRERPYDLIYSRLTTRSNSYTVQVWVQTLKKMPQDPQPNVWKSSDLITGEWRGSYEIERYLDPQAAPPAFGQPLGPYHLRIVSRNRFTP